MRRCCFIIGIGLIVWTAVEFFLLAFLTSRLMEGAGIYLWILGYFRVLITSPVGIAGILFLAAGALLIKARS